MFFFRKKRAAGSVKTDTIIGERTVVTGKIVTNASMLIEGTVTGDIECGGDVTVGERGVVRSNMAARNVLNAGYIEGTVRAKEKITITSKGRIEGNISAGALRVAVGGVLRGECVMELPGNGERLTAKDAKEAREKKGRAENSAKPATA